MTLTEEQHKALRAPFPPAAVGKLPKLTCTPCVKKTCQEHRKAKCNVCGNYISTAHIDLDYVGHAEVTDRLLSTDPEWTWEPAALGPDGGPLVRRQGNEATLWIRLTVCGVTRLGVGSVAASAFDAEKQLIGDALRNAAMRFGVALDLWSKNELESALVEEAAPAPPADSPIDCPEACGLTHTKDAIRVHLVSDHGWTQHDDGRVSRPPSPAPASTGPSPEQGEHDSSPGAGPPAPLGTREEAAAEGAHPPAAASPGNVSTAQVRLMHVLLGKLNVGESDKHRYCCDLIGIPVVESLNDLTKRDARVLIDALQVEAGEPAKS